jgi:hypothetical protein
MVCGKHRSSFKSGVDNAGVAYVKAATFQRKTRRQATNHKRVLGCDIFERCGLSQYTEKSQREGPVPNGGGGQRVRLFVFARHWGKLIASCCYGPQNSSAWLRLRLDGILKGPH